MACGIHLEHVLLPPANRTVKRLSERQGASPSSTTKRRVPRVLIVGTLHRRDILSMFDAVGASAKLTFLEYLDAHATEVGPGVYAPYGPVRYWFEFSHVADLLDQLRPERIFFMAHTSLNQVVLHQAARERGVPTFHLEHGFRLPFSDTRSAAPFEVRPDPASAFRDLLRGNRWRAQTHAFLFRSLPLVRLATALRIAQFAARYYRHGESQSLLLDFADLRRPTAYVAFSQATMAFHAEQDQALSQPVRFIGIPYFDGLASVRPGNIDPKNVLLIDHQLHNGRDGGVFGWTLAYRHRWVREIARLVDSRGMRLFIKQHPGDKSDAWRPYLRTGSFELVELPALAEVVCTTRLVLGVYSTMMLPLAALRHTANVLLEIHPEPGNFPGQSLVDAGVVTPACSFEQLAALLDNPNRLLESQRLHKERFEANFLYRFDGQAAKRLAEVVVGGLT